MNFKIVKNLFKSLFGGADILAPHNSLPASKKIPNVTNKKIKKSISPKKFIKNKNPKYGRVATTTNDYRIKKDGTQIDLFIEKFLNKFSIDSNQKIKVSGLSGRPRRERNDWQATSKKRIDQIHGELILSKKLYKIGVEFNPKNLSINLNQFENSSQQSYVDAVLKPLNLHLQNYFFQNKLIDEKVTKVAGGFKSNGKVSVWFNVWCEISAIEVFHHLPRFRTGLMSANPIESITVLNGILLQHDISIRSCYEDYAVQSKLFKQMERQLFKRLNIDPIRWKNQELLTAFIKKNFDHVKTEHSPTWLGKQRYDIYIPSKKIAIEYQGQQHYEPVSFFGGEKGFKNTLLLDKKKLDISRNNGVSVIYWDYRTKINEATVQKFLLKHNLF
tara:strand:- start:799 stop:1959 length:1161 start_codon:yes stop_codon:yes gene_type:complete